MPVYLPRNLAVLARLAGENPRYALAAVHVLDPGDTTYRVEASDGKRLAVVRGNSPSGLDYPTLDTAPAGGTARLVATSGPLVGRRSPQAGRLRPRDQPPGVLPITRGPSP